MSSIAAVKPTIFSDAVHDGRRARSRLPGFDPRLESIIEKVHAGGSARGGGEGRFTREDGLLLYETPDIWTLCALADFVRRRLHGDVAYYNVNRHLNYSNICALSCKFCAFYRKKDQAGAYEHSIEQIREEARKARDSGATEIHIVGGLHPWLPFEYYLDMMRAIREEAPALHIKAFTAVEIVHLARISKRGKDGQEGIRSVLSELRDAGLGSLPGGGAEVFDDRVHDEAFKGKIRAGTWLDVHRIAHELGINSNATMLYGHVEQRAERINHMLVLREAQDAALARICEETKRQRDEETKRSASVNSSTSSLRLSVSSSLGTSGCFQTIIPLPFFPDESELQHLPAPTGLENLRTLAICRLMLDNFAHVKAFWIMQTLGMAQFMLQNGADDIDGTVIWYDITKVGGDTTHQEVGVFELQRAIREAGFKPVERDTLYRPVIREGATWRIASST
jgi:aminodeoxyfutalosine synthase